MADDKDDKKGLTVAESSEENEEMSSAAKVILARGTDLGGGDFSGVKGSRWDNFWYHYKWHTIVAIIAAIFLAITLTQFFSKEKPDIFVMYAGPIYINADENTEFRSAIRQVMSEDFNGDGEKGVSLTDITYLDPEQVDEAVRKAAEEGIEVVVDATYNYNALNRYNMEAFSGEAVIYFVDPGLYESVKEAGGFLPLTEIFGDDGVPESAVDEFGVRLHDLDFTKFFNIVQVMPEDTILCIRRVSTMSVFKGKRKTETIHAHHVQMFRDIVEFTVPE